MDESRYVQVAAAARELACSSAWVRVLVDRGQLAAERTSSGQRLILRSALDEMIRNRTDREVVSA